MSGPFSSPEERALGDRAPFEQDDHELHENVDLVQTARARAALAQLVLDVDSVDLSRVPARLAASIRDVRRTCTRALAHAWREARREAEQAVEQDRVQ